MLMKNTCTRVSFLKKVVDLGLQSLLAQLLLDCKFYEIVKNNFFHLRTTASEICLEYTGCPQKSTSNFEGQCPTFSFNKIHQKYTNIIPYKCNFDNYRFFRQITFWEEIIYFTYKRVIFWKF